MKQRSMTIIEPVIAGVAILSTKIEVKLDDGRVISVPLGWLPEVDRADHDQRREWHVVCGNTIVWPVIPFRLEVGRIMREVVGNA